MFWRRCLAHVVSTGLLDTMHVECLGFPGAVDWAVGSPSCVYPRGRQTNECLTAWPSSRRDLYVPAVSRTSAYVGRGPLHHGRGYPCRMRFQVPGPTFC
ncbi:hypothetical protein BDY21DRAFT_336221 [Lineolata rhizophorae]|uniref:Secreted protein n=1 Tax=Lineolata rhizophorae TaxID=578093 RepID=A0A6A6PAB1_9PEZI|nr:hypothetical protein BDY21DRAFT_336221 [Lineolata rhizophorae]